MKGINKTLKTASIWCFVATLLGIGTLFYDIFAVEFSIYNIIIDAVCIGLSIFTAVVYLIYCKKTKQEILNKYRIFYTLCFANILNSLIVWVVAFWVQMSIGREIRGQSIKRVFTMPNFQTEQSEQNEKASNNDPNTIVLDEEDYEIRTYAQNLTVKLEELKTLRSKNLISEEEYQKLRQEAINNFMN